MKTFIVLLAALVATTEAASDDEAVLIAWNTFKEKYGKIYENDIEEFRKITFMETMDRITEHNSKYELGLVSFKLGINEYSDMPHDEFLSTMTGFNPGLSNDHKKPMEAELNSLPFHKLPKTVDWRNKGAVTEVKKQGRCGACWAFSATGALEAQYFLKSGKLVTLSEQNLIDCMRGYGTSSCKSGSMAASFLYTMDYGLEGESTYPYENKKSLACWYDKRNFVTRATGYVNLPEGSEKSLQSAVANVGPVSTGFYARLKSFKDYHSGIYNDSKCLSDFKSVTHAVLVVGYGSENGHDYWVIKNSWGKSWGENGYMKVARNQKNRCGIATCATYPMI